MSTKFDTAMNMEVNNLVRSVENVAMHILQIPGDKVISIATGTSQGIFTFPAGEPDDDYERELPDLLERILDGLIEDGMILIRQFTGETRKAQIRGIPTIVPTVNTYAIRLSSGKWYGLSAEHVEIICSTNLKTGELTAQPPGVNYLDFVS